MILFYENIETSFQLAAMRAPLWLYGTWAFEKMFLISLHGTHQIPG